MRRCLSTSLAELSSGLAESASEAGGKLLGREKIEILLKFSYQLLKVTTHPEGYIKTEATDGIGLAFGIYLGETEVEEVGAHGFRIEILRFEQLEKEATL